MQWGQGFYYVCCRIQSLFNSLGDEKNGKTIALGGDGRYFNKQAAQEIIKLAAGNGVKKVGAQFKEHFSGRSASSRHPAGWQQMGRRKLLGCDCRDSLPKQLPACLPLPEELPALLMGMSGSCCPWREIAFRNLLLA